MKKGLTENWFKTYFKLYHLFIWRCWTVWKCRPFNGVPLHCATPIVTQGVGIFFISSQGPPRWVVFFDKQCVPKAESYPNTQGTLLKTVIIFQLFICFMFWGFSYGIKLKPPKICHSLQKYNSIFAPKSEM